jgi:ABC-type polar amino acid transport system ATPase subunit
MNDRNLVELRGVRKAFGDNVVLDGVDLAVERGEVIVIAGPSGSGKSTMLRCINGLEGVDDGDVRFDGRSLARAGRTSTGSARRSGWSSSSSTCSPTGPSWTT